MFSLTRVTIEVIDQMVRPVELTLYSKLDLWRWVSAGTSGLLLQSVENERQGFIARNIGRKETLLIYLTIIPRGRVGYEMIESQRGA